MSFPKAEVLFIADEVLREEKCFDPDFLAGEYRHNCTSVIPKADDQQIASIIKEYLQAQRPMSVIRIGDGEACLLTYGIYPTPLVDQLVARCIIEMMQDRFEISINWMIQLKKMLHRSIHSADIIGLRGLWEPWKKAEDLRSQSLDISRKLRSCDDIGELRGLVGVWRSKIYPYNLAISGALKDKTIASAHLYFSIIQNLPDLIPHAQRVFIITSLPEIKDVMEAAYPDSRFVLFKVGESKSVFAPDVPIFLGRMLRLLPRHMTGTLTLVAAGVWSEIYCTWIKQRGGVAIDIGSGIDLLLGRSIRPIHKLLGLETNPRYKLL